VPISSDPEARARQIAALSPITKERLDYRATKPLRLTLPITMAEAFENLSKAERTDVVETGMRATNRA
jgi:hypothetical protein